jgi:hypothetical protein
MTTSKVVRDFDAARSLKHNKSCKYNSFRRSSIARRRAVAPAAASPNGKSMPLGLILAAPFETC